MMKISSLITESDDLYWQELARTGFWGKQAAGCIFLSNDTKRFCLAHRSKMVVEPGTWGTWGGAMDPGEIPIDAVKREAYEETKYAGNLELTPLYVYSHPEGFKYHNFLAVVDGEFEPKLNWETQGFGWFEWSKWPTPLHPGLKHLFDDTVSVDIIKNKIS